jgi:hypothetical protein
MDDHNETYDDKNLNGAGALSNDESQPLLAAPPKSLRRRDIRYGSRDNPGDIGTDAEHGDDVENEKTTLWQDLCWSASRGWWAGLLGVAVALFISHRILIAPYPFVRPILTPEQMSMESLVSSIRICCDFHECVLAHHLYICAAPHSPSSE